MVIYNTMPVHFSSANNPFTFRTISTHFSFEFVFIKEVTNEINHLSTFGGLASFFAVNFFICILYQ